MSAFVLRAVGSFLVLHAQVFLWWALFSAFGLDLDLARFMRPVAIAWGLWFIWAEIREAGREP